MQPLKLGLTLLMLAITAPGMNAVNAGMTSMPTRTRATSALPTPPPAGGRTWPAWPTQRTQPHGLGIARAGEMPGWLTLCPIRRVCDG